MKKIFLSLFLSALIIPVFAQNNSTDNPPNIFCINVPVERIYITTQGYVVQYRSSSSILATIGIPIAWFGNAVYSHGSTSYGGSANKAEVVRLPSVGDWPTMSIFYADGEFSHVRLYVHQIKSHPTWGSIRQGTDVSRFFGNGETFDIRY